MHGNRAQWASFGGTIDSAGGVQMHHDQEWLVGQFEEDRFAGQLEIDKWSGHHACVVPLRVGAGWSVDIAGGEDTSHRGMRQSAYLSQSGSTMIGSSACRSCPTGRRGHLMTGEVVSVQRDTNVLTVDGSMLASVVTAFKYAYKVKRVPVLRYGKVWWVS